MNNVISISDQMDWNTLSCLRGSITFYEENNHTGKYSRALEREGKQYFKYLDKYLGRE